MSRKFIATILAAALTITSFTAAPARADTKDVAKALAGIAALAIIADAVKDNDRDRRDRDYKYKSRDREHDYTWGGRDRHDRYRYDDLRPRPLPDRVRGRNLPGQCMVRITGRNIDARAFDERCLARNRVHVNRLPNDCVLRVRGGHPSQTYYAAPCLRAHGYRMARR